mgnify:CR=1 FL=1
MILILLSFLFPTLTLLSILIYVFMNWNKEFYIKSKKIFLIFGYIFGVYGYSMSFSSEVENDLTRYFLQIQELHGLSLSKIFALDTDKLYVKDILFYFVEKTGNVHLLPFIVGFIIYSIVFYILFDTIERSKRKFRISETFMLAIIAISILSPYTIISNTRCVLAYVLITFALYRFIVQKKRNLLTLSLYILPIWLHSSSIIVILIGFVCLFINSFSKISLILALSLSTLIDLAHSNVSKFNIAIIGPILTNAINKAYYYLHWTEGGWATEVENSVSSNLNRFVGSIFLILIIILIFKYCKKNKNIEEKKMKKKTYFESKFINYLYFIAIFALGCLSIKTGAFWRFESIVLLFSPVILIYVLENNESFIKYFKLLFLFCFGMFFVNIIYQMRNMNFSLTMYNYLICNGFKIFIEIIKGLINIL